MRLLYEPICIRSHRGHACSLLCSTNSTPPPTDESVQVPQRKPPGQPGRPSVSWESSAIHPVDGGLRRRGCTTGHPEVIKRSSCVVELLFFNLPGLNPQCQRWRSEDDGISGCAVCVTQIQTFLSCHIIYVCSRCPKSEFQCLH